MKKSPDQRDRGRLFYRSKLDAAGWTKAEAVLTFSPLLSDGAYRLHQAIRWHVGANDKAWPGQVRLGEELGISERQVSRLIAELKRLGLLTVEPRGQGHTADYILEPIPAQIVDSARVPGWYAKSGGFSNDTPGVAGLERTPESVLERTPVAAPTLSNQDPVEVEARPENLSFSDQKNAAGVYSPWIVGLVMEFAGADLVALAAPHVAGEVLALWQQSGLSEQAFVTLLESTIAEVRQHAPRMTPQAREQRFMEWLRGAVAQANGKGGDQGE